MKTKLLGMFIAGLAFVGCGRNECNRDSDCAPNEVCCLVYGVGGPRNGQNQCVTPQLNADGGLAGTTGADGGLTGCPGNL